MNINNFINNNFQAYSFNEYQPEEKNNLFWCVNHINSLVPHQEAINLFPTNTNIEKIDFYSCRGNNPETKQLLAEYNPHQSRLVFSNNAQLKNLSFEKTIKVVREIFILGKGKPLDQSVSCQEFFYYLKKGIKNPQQLYLLGNYFSRDNFFGVNQAASSFYFFKAAKNGNEEAICVLSRRLIHGIGVKKDPLDGLKIIEKASNMGIVDAIYELGRFYDEGLVVKKDQVKAFENFEKAANKGHLEAIYYLGLCYLFGQGTDPDPAKSFACFHKGAANGHREAAYQLGLAYLNGEGTSINYVQAYEHLKYAADLGHKESIYALASLYLTGRGQLQNKDYAYMYYKKAAELGDPLSVLALGECYLNGIGVEQNLLHAFDCFNKAVKTGELDDDDFFEIEELFYDENTRGETHLHKKPQSFLEDILSQEQQAKLKELFSNIDTKKLSFT